MYGYDRGVQRLLPVVVLIAATRAGAPPPISTFPSVILPADARDVTVTSPAVADIVLRTPRRISVMGVTSGQTDAVTLEDLTVCLERELVGTAALLSPANVKSYVLSVPQDAIPVEVTYQAGRNQGYVRRT